VCCASPLPSLTSASVHHRSTSSSLDFPMRPAALSCEPAHGRCGMKRRFQGRSQSNKMAGGRPALGRPPFSIVKGRQRLWHPGRLLQFHPGRLRESPGGTSRPTSAPCTWAISANRPQVAHGATLRPKKRQLKIKHLLALFLQNHFSFPCSFNSNLIALCFFLSSAFS